MRWSKKGLIYAPNGESSWAKFGALTPTPYLIAPDILRVYASFRDEAGIGRIGYVDLDSKDPMRILSVSNDPVLDIGRPGCFDDNGVILGDIVELNDTLRMYYVGFQLVEKVKFLAFTGLAISTDGGCHFERYQPTPVVDRAPEGLYFRAIHSITYDTNRWTAWYGVGSEFEIIGGQLFPRYTVHRMDSPDGLHFPAAGLRALEWTNDEYRLGRPRVMKRDGNYEMFYTIGTTRKTYLPGYATSRDGLRWRRRDAEIGLAPSPNGWDSLHVSYLAPITVNNATYGFYNGNNMGATGFGLAILEEGDDDGRR